VLYNDETDTLQIMREKENESDYRFVRESNIPSIDLSPLIDEVDIDVKYLPYTIERSLVDVGIRPQDATYFSSDLLRAQRLFAINAEVHDLAFVAKTLSNEVKDEQFADINVPVFSALLTAYIADDQFSHSLLQDVLSRVLAGEDMDFMQYIKENTENNEQEITKAIDAVIGENDSIVAEIKAGNTGKI
jgi:aspartyl-tRNA synthetase